VFNAVKSLNEVTDNTPNYVFLFKAFNLSEIRP